MTVDDDTGAAAPAAHDATTLAGAARIRAGAHTSSDSARDGTADWWRPRQTETARSENFERRGKENGLLGRGAKRVAVRFERDGWIPVNAGQRLYLETGRRDVRERMLQAVIVIVVVVVVFFG